MNGTQPQTLDIYDHNCERCQLSKMPRILGKHVCVGGVGAVPSEILLMGEGPGAEEETQGQPFVGESGRMLDTSLLRAGLSRGAVFIDNSVRCRPPNNRDPEPDEQTACLYYTIRMLAAVKPKVIVAVGKQALIALTGQKKALRDQRGQLLSLKREYRSAIPVIATYHPASGLHTGNRERVMDQIAEDLRFAQRVIASQNEAAAPDVRSTEIVTTSTHSRDEVKAAIRKLAAAPRLYPDLEWSVCGRKKQNGRREFGWPWSVADDGEKPVCTAIGMAGMVDGVPLSVSIQIPDAELERGMVKLMERTPCVYHNAVSDLIWQYSRGHKPILGGDTMMLGSVLNLDSRLSLEAMASLLTNQNPNWKRTAKYAGDADGGVLPDRDSVVGKVPRTDREWRALLDYNGQDCIATMAVEARLYEIAEEQGYQKVMPLYESVLVPAVAALARASLNGMPIDVEMLERAYTKAQRRIHSKVQAIADALGIGGGAEAVVLKDSALGPALVRAGIPLPMTPKTGRPQITELELLQHRDRHPAIPPLLELRKLTKWEGTYGRPWLELLRLQGDRRLHSIYNPAGARTGRTSAESERGGHAQNFPRKGSMRRTVQARPGWQIVAADESQVEMRIAALVAHERTMLRFIHDGTDMHYATAGWIKLFGNSGGGIPNVADYVASISGMSKRDFAAIITEDERYAAKPVNFSQLYGAGEGVLIAQALKDYDIVLEPSRAKLMRDGFFLLYNDLVRWHESCWADVHRGYCESPFGRRRMVENDEPHEQLRKMINTPVQNTANDIAMAALAEVQIEIDDRGWSDLCLFIGYVHDSIMFEAHESVIPQLEPIIVSAMEHPRLLPYEIGVPLKADIKVSERWEDAA